MEKIIKIFLIIKFILNPLYAYNLAKIVIENIHEVSLIFINSVSKDTYFFYLLFSIYFQMEKEILNELIENIKKNSLYSLQYAKNL